MFNATTMDVKPLAGSYCLIRAQELAASKARSSATEDLPSNEKWEGVEDRAVRGEQKVPVLAPDLTNSVTGSSIPPALFYCR